MKLLKITHHPDVVGRTDLTQFTRLSSRAIVLDGSKILLLYTERYDDYSLPGGGIDEGEPPMEGMCRELREETGAQNIKDIKEFGKLEEYRPWLRDDYDVVHMVSYCFTCSIGKELSAPQHEPYEKKNGMSPEWIEIDEALAHNQKTLNENKKQGLSLEREIFFLQTIKTSLVTNTSPGV